MLNLKALSTASLGREGKGRGRGGGGTSRGGWPSFSQVPGWPSSVTRVIVGHFEARIPTRY